jgi:hypothetical protein
MNYMKTRKTTAFSLAVFASGLAFTCAPIAEAASAPATAYVYVQTTNGVSVYDATAAGQLTLVKGSPFATTGQMEGINGKYLISVGTNYLHTYSVGSNGAVGSQVSQINTQSYGGGSCGATTGNGSVLDHSGKYLYVSLFTYINPDQTNCAAWQSYQIGSNGSLTFLGDVEYSDFINGWAEPSTVPTISSNDNFAYGTFQEWDGVALNYNLFSTFSRASNGVLEINAKFQETDPVGRPGYFGGESFTPGGWFPLLAQADPSNHLAALLYQASNPSGCICPVTSTPQLASYTINTSTGSIVSTNSYTNMPTPSLTRITGMKMSPSGKLIALGGMGIQIFHFNGASPLTSYSAVLLPTTTIDQLGWDNNNHLYALSYSAQKLYVYNVTPTSISAVSGSPYSVGAGYGLKGLIVVPK